MDQVCSQLLSFSGFSDFTGELLFFADYSQWEDWFELSETLLKTKSNKAASKDSEPAKKKLSYKEKLELEKMEASIADLEEKIGLCQKTMLDPQMATQANKLLELSVELGQLQSQLETSFERWSELDSRSKT